MREGEREGGSEGGRDPCACLIRASKNEAFLRLNGAATVRVQLARLVAEQWELVMSSTVIWTTEP